MMLPRWLPSSLVSAAHIEDMKSRTYTLRTVLRNSSGSTRAENSPPGLPLCAVNGFRDQFNCHKFTVNDIIQRIRNVSNEMETKGLLADAGLKSGEMDLRGVISGKLQGRQQEKRVSRR